MNESLQILTALLFGSAQTDEQHWSQHQSA